MMVFLDSRFRGNDGFRGNDASLRGHKVPEAIQKLSSSRLLRALHALAMTGLKLLISLFFVGCLNAGVALATSRLPAPLALLKNASSDVLQTLKAKRTQIRLQPEQVEKIVRKKILPLIAINDMSRSVIGRFWKKATQQQRRTFKKRFSRLVIRTYSAPLADYRDEQIHFYPMRKFSSQQTIARVRSLVIRSNGQKIPVDYRLIREGNRWQVSDFSVDGVSLVENYRAQFSSTLNQYGIAGLLKRLR